MRRLSPGLILAGDDHGLEHGRMLGEPGLDLAQLDAEAADLHLIVVAAQELEVAVRQVAGQVPGLVEPVARHERAGDELLRRQLRPVQIAPRNPSPADVDLPNRPKRNRRPSTIQKINPRVRNRTANGDRRAR